MNPIAHRREVAAVGPEVEGLQVGDRVALEPGVPCWHNSYSRCILGLCLSAVKSASTSLASGSAAAANQLQALMA